MSHVRVRGTTSDDAGLLESLALRCPPLDVHTPYTYWVLSTYFSESCFVAVEGTEPVGFVTAVANRDRALLWQIGILPAHRGKGLSHLLIDAVAGWADGRGFSAIELSIDPANKESHATFRSFAKRAGWDFGQIGSVDLTSAKDPSFREHEIHYILRNSRP